MAHSGWQRGWVTLEGVVKMHQSAAIRVRKKAKDAPPPDTRTEAAAVCIEAGQDPMDVGINHAALALALSTPPIVYEVGPAVSELVNHTDLHRLPPEAPKMMRSVLLIQVPKPERGKVLFGDTVCLGVYELNSRFYFCGLLGNGGAVVGSWTPRWSGDDLEEGVTRELGYLLDGTTVEQHRDWTTQAVRYVLMLAILSEADGAPLEWRGFRAHVRTAGAQISGQLTDEEEERIARYVAVRGHLKTQRYGAGHSKTKWIYVAQYAARRWVAPR